MSGEAYCWGRHPAIGQRLHMLAWQDQTQALLADLQARVLTTLPFGNGRSYGDSCLATSDHVIGLGRLDRFIWADWKRGIVRAEAGMQLNTLIPVALSRGWFPAVTPGTRFVTLGGALANDVHGKNHHRRGTFGCHVRAFGLMRSDLGVFECSPDSNPELYSATIGGLGLTGVVTWVELQLMPVPSGWVDCNTRRFDRVDEFLRLSAELDERHEYAVAWIDCLSRSGRGVYFVGDHAAVDLPPVSRARPLGVPVTPPCSLVNRVSLALFNEAYWRKHSDTPRKTCKWFEPFFFPLDRIAHWNRIYGRRGFQQFQCVLPDASAEPALRDLLGAIADSKSGAFLAVLKRCGAGNSPGLLSFPMSGYSLALDFPHSAALSVLFERLDAIVDGAGGRLYPAKDAHMQGAHFRRAYPAWERLERLRDPALMSRFWERVTT